MGLDLPHKLDGHLGASLVDVVNSADASGQTLVHLAAPRGHAEALAFLLYSALPEWECAKVIYAAKDHKESMPIKTARRKRYHDVVSVLERLLAERAGGSRGVRQLHYRADQLLYHYLAVASSVSLGSQKENIYSADGRVKRY